MSRPDSSPDSDLPGGYRRLERLGRGAFGEVWRAQAPGGLEVAVKIVHHGLQASEARREAQALQLLSRLRHHNLLGVQAAFAEKGQLFIVLELADGNLRQRLRECQKAGQPGIPPGELLGYLHEAAEALDYLHEHNVLHRDIKSENLLLLGRHVKVADFGLARLLNPAGTQKATTMVGTPSFMPPEIWSGHVSVHSDQYSLAITVAELRLGRLPFAGSNLAQQMVGHLQHEPDLQGMVPAEQQVLRRALAKHPDQRYPSCAAFAQALTSVLATAKDRETGLQAARATGGPTPRMGLDPKRAAPRPNPKTRRKSPPTPTDLLPQATPTAKAVGQARSPRKWLTLRSIGCLAAVAAVLAAIPLAFALLGELGMGTKGNSELDKNVATIADKNLSINPAKGAVIPDKDAVKQHKDKGKKENGQLSAPPVAEPFVLPVTWPAGNYAVKPVSFGPDWLGFNPRGDFNPWHQDKAFARLATPGTLAYASLRFSRYVAEFTVEMLGLDKEFRVCLGHPWSAVQVNFGWDNQEGKASCVVDRWQCTDRHGGGWSGGGRHLIEINKPQAFKLVVADGQQILFLNEQLILEGNAWPEDFALRLVNEKAQTAVIHRLHIREIRADDLPPKGRKVRPYELPLEPKLTFNRLKTFRKGSTIPQQGKPFVAGTLTFPLVWIKPGEFDWSDGGQPPRSRRVRLTNGYWMSQFEVTQGQYEALMDKNPSQFGGSPYLPVDWVSWSDAMEFCRKLNEAEKAKGRLPAGYEYRLPTEAEWEYACRADEKVDYSLASNQFWHRGSSDGRPHEVGEQPPNAWGLYDMHGNAMEWCYDWFTPFPEKGPQILVDPVAKGDAESGTYVVRGGAWWGSFEECSCSWRAPSPNVGGGYRGFRIVLGYQVDRMIPTAPATGQIPAHPTDLVATKE